MNYDDRTNKITFDSTQRSIYAYGDSFSGWVGELGDVGIGYGSDGGWQVGPEEYEVTPAEALEIADQMLLQWQAVRARLEEMANNSPGQANNSGTATGGEG